MFQDVILQITLASIMFGIGITLYFKDFFQLFARPKPVLLGLFLQMLFLPLLAFLVLFPLDISPYWKAGIMILSFCPGGATSNFITHLLGLNTVLSVSLTIVNSFIILLSIPLGVAFTIHYFFGSDHTIMFSLMPTFWNVLLVVFCPTLLGMLFEKVFPKVAAKLVRPLKFINIILLGATVLLKSLMTDGDDVTAVNWEDSFILLPILLAIHFGSMFLSGYVASKMTNYSSGITIGVEVGLQNVVLSLLVISYFDNAVEMSQPCLIYSLFSFLTTLAYGYYGRRIVLPKKGDTLNY